MVKHGDIKNYPEYIGIALLAGFLIGILKFIVYDLIGFSLIIIFSLLYGTGMFRIIYRLSRTKRKLWASRMIVILVVIATLTVVITYYTLDYKYTEYKGLMQLASEGEDITNLYLTFDGYIEIHGSAVSAVGYLIPILPISGAGIWILDAIEFLIIGFACMRGIREAKPRDWSE